MRHPGPFSPKAAKVLSFILFLICSLLIYLISPDSRVDALACSGNYYYSRQQIYELADLSAGSRTILKPYFVIEQQLEKDPLIESANVSYLNGGISIDVVEKTILGYFVEEGNTYLLCMDGQTIPVDSLEILNSLSEVPQLAGFSRKQMEKIALEFNKYSEYITRETISKIAEMVPWEESYDSSMIKMTMQDGNVVISSISDLLMISKYQLLLSRLQGDHVCLFLDKEHSAIDKISCSYIYMSSEERDEYRKELREELERIQKEAEQAAKAAQEALEQNDSASDEENQEDETTLEDETALEDEPFEEENPDEQEYTYEQEDYQEPESPEIEQGYESETFFEDPFEESGENSGEIYYSQEEFWQEGTGDEPYYPQQQDDFFQDVY